MSRRRLALFAVGVVLVVLFGGRWLALRYTEHLWFAELGQSGRHWRLVARALAWQAGLLLACFLWFAGHTIGVYRSIGSVQLPQRLGDLEIAEAVPQRTLRAVALAAAGLLAIAVTWAFADYDRYVALSRNFVPIGLADPVLHRDAGFYLARLPLLEITHLLATVAVALAGLVTISFYAVTGSLSVSARRVRVTPHARTHITVLLAVLALVLAWGFHLDTLGLVAGGGSHGGALSTVDRVIRIPASTALSAVALIVAAGTALSMRVARPLLLLVLWTVLGAAALVGRVVVPAARDAWGAEGDPAVAAAMARHAASFTSAAFGLVDVATVPLRSRELRPSDAEAVGEALAAVPAWTGEPVLLAAELSRATGDSARVLAWATAPIVAASGRPALLAAGQVDPAALAQLSARPRWTELHRGPLAWGGEPLALDAALRRGPPAYLADPAARDTAPPGTPIALASGRVRFLPRAAELGIVGPDEGSVGSPPPGVLLRGPVRRLLLAWALQSPPLMDSHTSPADRVLYWRDVPARLARLYPFADFDAPRPALFEGRLVWTADGYIASQRFPFARHVRWRGDDINFLAVPFLALVDAETGATRLFLRPPDLAFARGLARAEGVTVEPSSAMPAPLRESLRYPSAQFGAQAAALGMLLAGEGESPWVAGTGDSSQSGRDAGDLVPTTTLVHGDDSARAAWLFLPLMDALGSRLAGLAAATVRRDGTPHLEFLRAEGSALPTPQVAAARIASAPVVVAAAAGAGADGQVRHGPIQAVAVEGALAWARVLFGHGASTGRSATFEPAGVAVMVGSRIGFGPDAPSAVRALLRPDGGADALAAGTARLAEARAAFLLLDSARITGDWDRFGRAWEALRRTLLTERGPAGPRP